MMTVDARYGDGSGMELRWGARSDVGRVRRRNEDAVLADRALFVVADGMGGHAHGHLAATLTVEELRRLTPTERLTRADVLDAIRRADDDIREQAQSTAEGMGTTVSGMAVLGDGSLLVFNVGDSRCYRLRDSALVQLTHDHSVVQELLDAGDLSPEEVEHHPDRNVITRSLGGEEVLEIDWWLTEPRSGDRFLVCSDGVTREIDSVSIAQILTRAADPQDIADALVDAALAAGGRDNASAVVMDVVALEEDRMPHEEPPTHVGADEDDTAPRAAGVVADTSSPLVEPTDHPRR